MSEKMTAGHVQTGYSPGSFYTTSLGFVLSLQNAKMHK